MVNSTLTLFKELVYTSSRFGVVALVNLSLSNAPVRGHHSRSSVSILGTNTSWFGWSKIMVWVRIIT